VAAGRVAENEDEPVEAEAGALLAAEATHDIHVLTVSVIEFIKANSGK
jgi:hypothetical protein